MPTDAENVLASFGHPIGLLPKEDSDEDMEVRGGADRVVGSIVGPQSDSATTALYLALCESPKMALGSQRVTNPGFRQQASALCDCQPACFPQNRLGFSTLHFRMNQGYFGSFVAQTTTENRRFEAWRAVFEEVM